MLDRSASERDAGYVSEFDAVARALKQCTSLENVGSVENTATKGVWLHVENKHTTTL